MGLFYSPATMRCRFGFAGFVCLSTLAVARPSESQEVGSIAGTWSVTTTDTGEGDCPTTAGSVTTFQWLVSTRPDGTVSVAVTGENVAFPRLSGRLQGTALTLTGQGPVVSSGGLMGPSVRASCSFRLTLQGDELTGTRRYTGVNNGTACVALYTIRARKL